MNFRVGQGYDVHRLTAGRKLIIGGVEIPFHLGLLGHSDADVLTHAIIDALCGAAGLGDIGRNFPDTDDKYKNISSLKLLEEINQKLQNSGWKISNIDATLIAQSPKISPFIENIRHNIATTLNLHGSQINIKATTEEGLGFTGTSEGMAAQAICLIYKDEVTKQ